MSSSAVEAPGLQPMGRIFTAHVYGKDNSKPTTAVRYLGRPTSPNILQRPYRDVSVRYEFGKKIGYGTYGIVSRCVDRLTGEVLACKSIEKSQLTCFKDLETVRMEVQALEAVGSHPSVVSLKEVYEDPKNLHLVMELCEGGELFARLIQRKAYPEHEAAEICFSLASVLAFCHQRGIMHRDVKPENILLAARKDDTCIRLADFGQATTFQPGVKLTEVQGSALYIAPEVLRGLYGPEADVWSLGVTLYVLLAGVAPFGGSTKTKMFAQIVSGEYDLENGRWRKISKEAKDLVTRLLTVNAKERITLEGVKNHPWILEHCERPRPPHFLDPLALLNASSNISSPVATPRGLSVLPLWSPSKSSRSHKSLAGAFSAHSPESRTPSHCPVPSPHRTHSDSNGADTLVMGTPARSARALFKIGSCLPQIKPSSREFEEGSPSSSMSPLQDLRPSPSSSSPSSASLSSPQHKANPPPWVEATSTSPQQSTHGKVPHKGSADRRKPETPSKDAAAQSVHPRSPDGESQASLCSPDSKASRLCCGEDASPRAGLNKTSDCLCDPEMVTSSSAPSSELSGSDDMPGRSGHLATERTSLLARETEAQVRPVSKSCQTPPAPSFTLESSAESPCPFSQPSLLPSNGPPPTHPPSPRFASSRSGPRLTRRRSGPASTDAVDGTHGMEGRHDLGSLRRTRSQMEEAMAKDLCWTACGLSGLHTLWRVPLAA